MPEIHQVEEAVERKHVIDPYHGMTIRMETVVKPSTTAAISHEGVTYKAVDGTFDVPQDVANLFLGYPGWAPGPNPFAEVEKPKRARAKSGE